MIRTTEHFAKAFNDAQRLANMHKKPFWVIPTKTDYVVSCFDKRHNLPDGTNTLKVEPKED